MGREKLPEDVAAQLERANIQQVARDLKSIYEQKAISERQLFRLKANPNVTVNSKTISQLTTYFRSPSNFKAKLEAVRATADRIRAMPELAVSLLVYFFDPDSVHKTAVKILESAIKRGLWPVFRLAEEIARVQASAYKLPIIKSTKLSSKDPRRARVITSYWAPNSRVNRLIRKLIREKKIREVSQERLTDILCKGAQPSLEELVLISCALQVPLGELFQPSRHTLEFLQWALRETVREKAVNGLLNDLRCLFSVDTSQFEKT